MWLVQPALSLLRSSGPAQGSIHLSVRGHGWGLGTCRSRCRCHGEWTRSTTRSRRPVQRGLVFATAALTPETWRRVRFDASGLVPAIVQESETGQVLMLAYMNREALTETLHTGRAVFYSRSRQALWRKGDTSGQVQWVQELFFDCDMDAVLVRVKQVGVACHTGRYSCFWQRITSSGQTEEALPVLIDPEELYHHPGLQDTKRQP